MKKTEKGVETSPRALEHGLRRIERRHVTNPGEVTLKEAKVRVTMYLDADILEYFKERAAEPNAAPYKTQINNELRNVLEDKGGASRYADLINDERFIEAVAKKLRRAS